MLGGEQTTIGRHPQSDVCVHDPMVSKSHAQIIRDGEKFIFRDLGSSNGSFIAGVRVTERTMKDGDVITLGHASLTFELNEMSESVARMVNFVADSENSQIQERVQLESVERFLPEQKVFDLNVLRMDYEKLRLGNELLQRIGLERSMTAVMQKVADELMNMFPADRCVIMLKEDDSEELMPYVVQSISGQSEDTVHVSQSVLKEVMNSKSAVLISEGGGDDFAPTSSLVMQGIRAVLCAPIMHGDQFLGIVHLDSQQQGSSFEHKDLMLLGSILRFVAMFIVNSKLIKEIEQQAKARVKFERLLSPSVVEQLMQGKISLEQGGELRNVTIMFADIRGFTKMAQSSTAPDLVKMLNSYFEMLVEIIFEYGGTVDKFIGDEVMVLFGAPVDMPNAADQAVACALRILSALESYNQNRRDAGEEEVKVGIGISTGEVVVGSIGSSRTMQYTCIGDAVNIASRLTDIAEGNQILITDATRKRMKSKVKTEPLPQANLKGIAGKTLVHSVKEVLDITKGE